MCKGVRLVKKNNFTNIKVGKAVKEAIRIFEELLTITHNNCGFIVLNRKTFKANEGKNNFNKLGNIDIIQESQFNFLLDIIYEFMKNVFLTVNLRLKKIIIKNIYDIENMDGCVNFLKALLELNENVNANSINANANVNSININNLVSKIKPFFPIIGFYTVMNLPIYGIGKIYIYIYIYTYIIFILFLNRFIIFI